MSPLNGPSISSHIMWLAMSQVAHSRDGNKNCVVSVCVRVLLTSRTIKYESSSSSQVARRKVHTKRLERQWKQNGRKQWGRLHEFTWHTQHSAHTHTHNPISMTPNNVYVRHGCWGRPRLKYVPKTKQAPATRPIYIHASLVYDLHRTHSFIRFGTFLCSARPMFSQALLLQWTIFRIHINTHKMFGLRVKTVETQVNDDILWFAVI